MYLTYDDYVSMGGTLDSPIFNELEYEAETSVNWYTFNRLEKFEEIPMDVKKVMFKLIKLYASTASYYPLLYGDGSSAQKGAVASQSNDGVSMTYSVLSASESISKGKEEAKNCIYRGLSNVKDALGRPILFRGLYPDE